MTSLFAFLVTLAILIAVHEAGHFIAARWCGVRVLQFSIGFGKPLWRHRGKLGTEFRIGALPLGGYVRMLDTREQTVPMHRRPQAFDQKPLHQRVLVVAAGPFANLGLAVILFAFAAWWGALEPRPILAAPSVGSIAERAGVRSGDWVRAWSTSGDTWEEIQSMGELRWHVSEAILGGSPVHLQLSDRDGHGRREVVLVAPGGSGKGAELSPWKLLGLGGVYSAPVIEGVQAGGPAEIAGLQPGDLVRRWQGREVPDASTLRAWIRASASGKEPDAQAWVVQRGDTQVELVITPKHVFDGDQRIARVEAMIGAPPQTSMVSKAPLEAILQGWNRTVEVSVLTLRTLGQMIVGQASVKHLSGPFTIADGAGQSIQQGFVQFVAYVALISVSLGLLNLLPLPMLDGGHLMYYLFEAVTGRPVSDLWLHRVQRAGLVLLSVLMFIALYNDLTRLLGLN